MTRLVHAGLYLLGAFILDRIWRAALRRVKAAAEDEDPTTRSELERRVETLTAILGRLGAALLYCAALLIILYDFGVQIGPLLAGMGIAGVAVGFGAQYLVRDLITGFYIVLENQFRVGDTIRINEFTGAVEQMHLRTTQLRAAGGEVHIIPNGEIKCVTNLTRQWARAILDIPVAYRSDLGKVFAALEEAGRKAMEDASLARAILDPVEVLGVQELGNSFLTVRIAAKTDPLRRMEVERALRRFAKESLEAHGIECPPPLLAAVSPASAGTGKRGER